MKVYYLFLFTLLFSCDEKNKPLYSEETDAKKTETSAKIPEKDTTNLHPWFQYYRKENPNFKREIFKPQESTPITYRESFAPILHQKGFNPIYKPFLVFNQDRDQYLDFDSYQWELLPDGSAAFEADQALILVDLKNKKAQQIAFFGPSFWIEDAYWKGDSVAVILGNTYEKVPFIMEYNFNKKIVNNYKFPDSLKIGEFYSKYRLRRKGIQVD